MEITGWRTQWAVGQGSFHTGFVRARSRAVPYVYDCGTQPRYLADLAREVDIAVDRLRGQVDLLYLSHFHFDHVSGVEQLLNGASVQRVVLPLTPAADRLIALAAALRNEERSPVPDWYVELVASPLDYFGSRGLEVTEVMPDNAGDLFPPEVTIGQESDFNAGLRPPEAGRVGSGLGTAALEDQVSWLWLWVPWTSSRTDATQGLFLTELGRALDKRPNEIHAILEDPEELKAIGTRRRSELRRAYDAAVGPTHLNLTSMALYSGPPSRSTSPGLAVGYFEQSHPRAEIRRRRAGWLGSGDAELGTSRDAAEFRRAFSAARREIGTFVLPHHGSDRSSHPRLVADFEPGTTFVASADRYGRWTHPGPRVTREALKHGHLAWVRHKPSTRWTEEFAVDQAHP